MASILVTHTSHFVRGPDGHVYAPHTLVARDFWARYRAVFDHVTVAARVRNAGDDPNDLPRADGEGVEFCDLPDYTGAWQYLRSRTQMRIRFRQAIEHSDVFCLRVPCAIATIAWRELRRSRRAFGVEVVGDPWESLATGGVRSVARPIARRAVTRALRAQCREACAAWYVTREALQRRYPSSSGAFQTHCSDIELPSEGVADAPRTGIAGTPRLIYVGTLAVLYKAPDILIRAVAHTGRSDLRLTIVGDGRKRKSLETLAASLGVTDRVTFAGYLPAGQGVRDALDAADIFVLPSRTEGLPRAMIEAMARGLPCIGSAVGGIPELLPPEDLVPAGDVPALADKIMELIDCPERFQAASKRNLEASRQFLPSILEARRNTFYTELLQRSSG